MKIDVGAHVRTRDGRHVGEVHRVVVDLDDQAVTAIVVLRGRWLSRDVLVPTCWCWIREGGVFAHGIRIPVEWVERAVESGISLAASKVDIETGFGPPTRQAVPGPDPRLFKIPLQTIRPSYQAPVRLASW